MNAKAMCVAMEAWDDFTTEPNIDAYGQTVKGVAPAPTPFFLILLSQEAF